MDPGSDLVERRTCITKIVSQMDPLDKLWYDVCGSCFHNNCFGADSSYFHPHTYITHLSSS